MVNILDYNCEVIDLVSRIKMSLHVSENNLYNYMY